MSDFFKEVALNPKKMADSLLGPNYKYYKYIRTPSELGMSSRGSMSALANDVKGLINYTEVLVSGTGRGSKTGRPLGNRFFLKTGATCKTKSGRTVDRYTYFDHIPDGSIPFLSRGAGIRFSSLKGIIPGMMGNISQMNPLTLLSGFMEGGNPLCTEICMSTVDSNNRSSRACRHVIDSEIKSMNPCSFPGKRNPLTGAKCRSGFVGNRKHTPKPLTKNLKNDPFANLYLFSFSLFLLFLIVKLQSKK